MKKDDILDAMSGIKDEYINEAVPGAARRKSSVWAKAGVIAACLCLFVAAGFLISYGMNEPAVKPPVATDTVGSGVETTAPATNETTGMVEDSTDTEDVGNDGIGGSDGCHLHHVSYHSIPGGLIDYVIENKGYSEAEVYEWLGSFTIDKTKLESTTECCDPLNIKLFIEKYGITKEEIYDNYSLLLDTHLNIELLYSEDETEIEKYFTDIDELNKNNVREAHYRKVRNLIGAKYEKELESLNIIYNGYSIPELVEVLSIDREELEGYIKTATDYYIENDGKCYTFDYNLDMLYGGENLEDLSMNQINEMFCRIGRYAE